MYTFPPSFNPVYTVFQLLYYLIDGIKPFLAPLSFIFAWGLIIIIAWSLWSAARGTVKIAKQMHQIPCSHCVFFTNYYRLKCTVNPSLANTEEAIDCADYRQKLRD